MLRSLLLLVSLALPSVTQPAALSCSGLACSELAGSALAQEKDLQTLLDDAASKEPRARRVALGRLADLGGEEAVEALIAGLADPEPEVADTAQIELARTPAEQLEPLHGRAAAGSKDALVRERTAELLGRSDEPVPARWLRDGVGDREAPVRRMAAWSAERLARRGWVGAGEDDGEELERLREALAKAARRDKDPGVAAAALLAWGQLEPRAEREAWWAGGAPTPAVEQAREALRDKQPQLRAAALTLLSEGARDGAARAASGALARELGQALADETAAVRRAAIEALGRLGSKAAMLELVAHLEVETNEALAALLLLRLRDWTGRRHGGDPRPWLKWLEGEPEDWRAATPEEIAAREAEREQEGGSAVQLAGLPLVSRRIAFLIDMSGSMWDADDAGRTLKDIVDVELRRCLEALPPETEFVLVPYATEPLPFELGSGRSAAVIEARPRDVQKALEWFEGCTLRGRGNVWDAFAAARALAEFDTAVIFTDGAPTGGPHWEMGLMTELLLESTRFSGVTFHSILTQPGSNRLRDHWRALSERSGGRSIVVDLKS